MAKKDNKSLREAQTKIPKGLVQANPAKTRIIRANRKGK